MDGLSHTLKLVHKVFTDIVRLVCSSAELVHKMWRLQFYRFFLQWFTSGGRQFYVSVADTVLQGHFTTILATET